MRSLKRVPDVLHIQFAIYAGISSPGIFPRCRTSRGDAATKSGDAAKVAINAEGRVTHLRVMRLAWPKLNFYAINEQAVDSIKSWRHKPTIVDGRPVAVCSDVDVTVDLE